jgi:hypothetical protein
MRGLIFSDANTVICFWDSWLCVFTVYLPCFRHSGLAGVFYHSAPFLIGSHLQITLIYNPGRFTTFDFAVFNQAGIDRAV